MDLLQEIVAHKRTETAERKALVPIKKLEQSLCFPAPPVSLRRYLQDPRRSGVIAEFKRRSPSKGPIAPYAKAAEITRGYMQAGAAALSVLTDTKWFGGSSADLEEARRWNLCPILRKDFIVDEYQVIEAKSIGADAVLLIAAVLAPQEVKRLAATAALLGMEVLLEVHDAAELDRLCDDVTLLGVNNRDLRTFDTDPAHSLRMAAQLPRDRTWVSESGIAQTATLQQLRAAGYRGFLIGEAFMRTPDPAAACASFIADSRNVPTAQ